LEDFITTVVLPLADLDAAMASWAGAVALLTIRDERDDVGVTVSAFCPVSLDPPLVLVSLMEESYPAEVLGGSGPPPFAVTLLSERQRMLAGRFAAAGRPGARLMFDDVPHRRGAVSGALIPDDGLAAFECSCDQRFAAGDHLVVIGAVTAVPYAADTSTPLIRFRNRYLSHD
jgi:flavin reductase (DIM6/NTAB) family NADH-FMN oxidoreductase RutF